MSFMDVTCFHEDGHTQTRITVQRLPWYKASLYNALYLIYNALYLIRQHSHKLPCYRKCFHSTGRADATTRQHERLARVKFPKKRSKEDGPLAVVYGRS